MGGPSGTARAVGVAAPPAGGVPAGGVPDEDAAGRPAGAESGLGVAAGVDAAAEVTACGRPVFTPAAAASESWCALFCTRRIESRMAR